ncbi:MAG: sensor histidine kinase, partial [Candidatus Binataceae bacterium]
MARDHGPFARAVSEPAHTSEAGWVTARQVAAEFDENAEAIAILKQATPVGIFFLLAYMIVDARAHVVTSGLIVSPYHWFALVTVLLFFGLTWLPGFRTHWRLWVLLCCITMIALMVQVGAATHDPDTGYLTIVLCPFAAAAFVVWGGRWQLILNLACLLIYTVAELAVPGGSRFEIHRALGMVAALTLAQFTAVFLDRYRRRLKGQLGQLAAAAEFRETQIATMTHDIRNPLATLVGLMTLLAENETGEKERARLLARMSSTTVSMDLIVKNLLDLYMLEEQHMRPNCRVIDVDAVVSETAERYAFEARQRGLRFAIEPGGVHQAKLDPLHLERIVANLVTSAVQR